MTADTGLCPLSHFDFNSGTGFKVILVDTKTSARYLNNSVFTVNIEILVQTTFACVVKNTKLVMWLLSQGNKIEVLRPESLRQEMKQKAEEILVSEKILRDFCI